jgi:NAD(P)-dependent dehydrogenase (short-subunit alcohol dehydrogenase family)
MTDSLFSVADRVVVLTGGLGQLGRQYASTLMSRGARVAIIDSRTDPQTEEVAFGRADRDRLMLLKCDITQRADLERCLSEIVRQWSVPQGLINNAAVDSSPDAAASENGPFEAYPEESWDRVIDVNLKGAMLCCQVFGGALAQAGRGSIINVGSIYGVVAPDQSLYDYRRQRGEVFYKPAAYSASKSALYNFTRYLATYWAPKVRVNVLTPAGVFNNQSTAFLERYESRMPMRRMARVHEYDGAIVFLLSDASSYMTGAELRIDGGWTAL